MNIKKVKKPKCFPYTEYTDEKDKIKLLAGIYDDGIASIIVKNGSKVFYEKENVKPKVYLKEIKEKIKDLELNIKNYYIISDFLKSIIKDQNKRKK